MQHQRVRSFRLLEYGLEDDVLKTIERGRSAFHPHAQNCTLPGSQKEFGEFHGIKRSLDLAGTLSLGDARRKRSAPFLKDRLQPLAQEFALRAGLKAEIANQAPAVPFVLFQLSADGVEKALQSLPGIEGLVIQSFADKPLRAHEKAVEDFLGKRLLGTEMIGEGTVRSSRGGADIPYRSPLISRAKHHLDTGIQNVFAKGGFAHNTIIRTYVLIRQAPQRPVEVRFSRVSPHTMGL